MFPPYVFMISMFDTNQSARLGLNFASPEADVKSSMRMFVMFGKQNVPVLV